MPLGRAFFASFPSARPSLLALEALRGPSGGANMPTLSGAGTSRKAQLRLPRARLTGFSHTAGALRLRGSGPSFVPIVHGVVYGETLCPTPNAQERPRIHPLFWHINLDLPEGEGTELLKELKGLPVLALIRSRNLQRRGEAIGLGAKQVLSTTGPPEKIAAAVERLICPRSLTAF
jgi:hypothetical protein